MIETLSSLFQAYLEWRAQPTEIYMAGFWAAAAPIIGSIAGAWIGSRKSGAEKRAIGSAQLAADAEAAFILQRKRLTDSLERLINTTPAAGEGILKVTGGKGIQLPRDLESLRKGVDFSDILSQINFTAEQDMAQLLQLLGQVPGGTANTQLLAANAFGSIGARSQAVGELVGNIIEALINRNTARSVQPVYSFGGGGGASAGAGAGFGGVGGFGGGGAGVGAGAASFGLGGGIG